jgi:type VI protein secretion system component Hcp
MSKQDEKLEQKSPAKSEIKCSALHDTDLEKVTGGSLNYGRIQWTYTQQKHD